MKKYIFLILFIILKISHKSYCHDFQSENQDIDANIKFVYSFINNPYLQYIFTNEFLFISNTDIYSLETPKIITRIVHKNEIHYPIIPSIKTICKHAQKIEKREVNENYMYIIILKEDTGLHIKYHFHKNEFWILYMIEDESI